MGPILWHDSDLPVPRCNDSALKHLLDIHRNTPALPFCHLKFSVKIRPPKYPKQIQQLGDHIRAKRLDNNLFQKDVAKIIGTSEESINHWEMNTTEPEIKFYPKIMEFLGYCPIHYAQNVGEILKLHRTHRGLTLEEFAKILQVDPGAFSQWETTGRIPFKKHRKKVENYIKKLLNSF